MLLKRTVILKDDSLGQRVLSTIIRICFVFPVIYHHLTHWYGVHNKVLLGPQPSQQGSTFSRTLCRTCLKLGQFPSRLFEQQTDVEHCCTQKLDIGPWRTLQAHSIKLRTSLADRRCWWLPGNKKPTRPSLPGTGRARRILRCCTALYCSNYYYWLMQKRLYSSGKNS